MLAWLLVALWALVVAQLVQARTVELACSGSGAAMLVVHAMDGTPVSDMPGPDCPLCLPCCMAPAPADDTVASAGASSMTTGHLPGAPPPPFTRHRPPARAPPLFS
ncbi:hypothetical protein [Acidovorax sp. BL-A-41-H1]|uniref:hypothetical protein n=1 Tax=Acidovorax sp. BL-A-41-H1 TaxID=3421102 RepID=UPI003F7A8CF0